MKLKELFFESLSTLTLNKTRTALAVLGIIIGIGSVIALMSLGQATQKSIQNQIESLGSNLLTVQPGASRSSSGVRSAPGSNTSLTLADAQAISSSSEINTVNLVSLSILLDRKLSPVKAIPTLKLLVLSQNMQ